MSVYNFPQFQDDYDGYKMRVFVDEIIRQFQGIQQQAPAAVGGAGGVTVHNNLTGRSDPDSHPIGAITDLQMALDSKFSQADGAALTITVANHELRITVNEAAIAVNAAELDHARTQRYFFGE